MEQELDPTDDKFRVNARRLPPKLESLWNKVVMTLLRWDWLFPKQIDNGNLWLSCMAGLSLAGNRGIHLQASRALNACGAPGNGCAILMLFR